MKAPAKRRAWAAKRPAKQEVDRFELAMRAINEGIYEWNIADGSTVYSDRVLRSLGLSRRQLRNAADWHQRIHPEDRARFDAALRDHFKGRTERFECDLRYRAGDGGWRWARQHGVAIRDAKGRAVRMIGSTGDITELKRVEEALKASEERYALATRAATEGIYEWNLESDSLYLSDRAKAFFAVAGEALTPAAWNARVHGEDFQGYRDAIVAFFKGRKPVFEHEYRIRDAAGGYAWVRDRAIAVRDPAGRVTRFVGALTDITQRRRAELELRRAHESTTEALARQTATAEILKAIAASPTDVRPVLEALARHAGELCGAAYVNVLLEEESMLRTMAVYSAAGGPPADTAFAMRALPTTVNGRAFVERRPVHVPDIMAVAATEYPDSLEFQRHFGFRTILGVPMLRAGQAIGTISIWRREVRPFSAEEIALIETFAAQAVIAIENVRLFNETKEALEQQTASSEILRVISSSPADLAPVFDAILGGAMQLCEAHLGTLNLYDGEWLHTVAQRGGNPQFAKWLLERGAIKPDGGMVHQAITERRGVQIADAREAPGYREGKPNISKFVDLGAVRTFLAVPLLKDSAVIGIIGIYRPEVRPFSEKQIALVSMFANQAVIAIENARLFNETREALERQTATAEILKVIARSPADVQPVFDAIVTAALKLCAATSANAVTFDGELIHVAAVAEAGASAAEALGRHFGTYPKRPSSDTANTRAILTRQVVAIPDVMEDAEYAAKATAVAAGYRSIVSVPLMRGQNPIGALTVARPEPGHFPERKLALLRTFADQAAIAIENARLFNETKEALEQQTATTNILHVISRSVTDLAPVFEAILENAITLCEGNVAALWQYDGTHLRFAAGKRVSPEATAHYRSHPLALGTYNPTPQAALERRALHVLDVFAERTYRPLIPRETFTSGRHAPTVLAVPLLRENDLLGVVTIWRYEKRLFTDRQVAMVNTFAAQAVIAIENVRLFNETTEALERQTATAEILKVISGSPTDEQPVFDAIVSTASRLFGRRSRIRVLDADRLQLRASSDRLGVRELDEDPLPVTRETIGGRVALDRAAAQVADTQAADAPSDMGMWGRRSGYRAIAGAPLMRGDTVLGVLSVTSTEPGALSDKEMSLLATFANQAAIAIENARLFNETREALERQTASARILRVIGSSPSDLQPVFDAILENAMHLCDASLATVGLYDGKYYRHVAQRGGSPEYEKFLFSGPFEPKPRYTIGHMIAERQPFHIADYRLLPDYIEGDLRSIATVELGGTRTYLAVPMLKDGHVVGGITVRRTEVRPFTQKQIDLVRTFADQAVIAIENARLFNETREALERQTATAEILRVISGSPTATQPVFESIVQKCHALYQDSRVALLLIDEGRLNTRASTGYAFEPIPIDRESGIGACVLEGRTIHLPDLEAAAEQYPRLRQLGIKHGYRSGMYAPLMREGRAIGGISVLRRVAGAFSEKDVALLTTFADQAVIAIENVRLFNETKEALEQQTAISEVLRVISSSPADIKPVLEVVASRAAHICDATDARIFVVEGDFMRHASGFGDVPVRTDLVPITRASTSGRAVIDRAPVHVPDIEAESPDEFDHQIARRSGWRSALAVPLMRETRALGAIVLRRREVRPFTEKQAALLATFADQAAIAIENVRLFNETKEALERQTATGEILKVMSASLTDVQPVFDAVALNAARVCGVDDVAILQTEGVNLRRVSHYGNVPVSPHSLVPVPPGSVNERVLSEHRTLHIPDTLAPSFTREFPGSQFPAMGVRALLATPLVRDGIAVGVIHLRRSEARPFTDKQIAMLETFADQAVIAIENVRLFNEIKDSLEQQKASAEVLAAISSSIADTQPVFEKILRSCERLFAGKLVGINLVDPDGLIRIGAYQGPGREELEKLQPFAPGEGSGSGAAVLHRRLMQYPDAQKGEETPPATRRGCTAIGVRSVVFAPMIWEERAIGVIFVGRDFAGEFSEKEIALLKTFADQAVIAIQNARLFREIAEKSRQLEEASRHKSQFLASMSHELRTPLNAILGFNEMILGQIYGEVPPDMKEPLEDIQKSGKHLLRLINNVLDLAKIEAGKMELALADYSVHDTVESVRSTLRPLAEAKGLELVVSVPEDIPLAYGDGGRLTQCLMNLAGNSLKFTKQGKVEIAVEAENGHLRWRVADTGIGIPPDKIPTLFSEFKQTDATIASEYGGTGLGLSITRKFVEMHGGRIWVESEPGKGSVFTVEIPLRVTAPA